MTRFRCWPQSLLVAASATLAPSCTFRAPGSEVGHELRPEPHGTYSQVPPKPSRDSRRCDRAVREITEEGLAGRVYSALRTLERRNPELVGAASSAEEFQTAAVLSAACSQCDGDACVGLREATVRIASCWQRANGILYNVEQRGSYSEEQHLACSFCAENACQALQALAIDKIPVGDPPAPGCGDLKSPKSIIAAHKEFRWLWSWLDGMSTRLASEPKWRQVREAVIACQACSEEGCAAFEQFATELGSCHARSIKLYHAIEPKFRGRLADEANLDCSLCEEQGCQSLVKQAKGIDCDELRGTPDFALICESELEAAIRAQMPAESPPQGACEQGCYDRETICRTPCNRMKVGHTRDDCFAMCATYRAQCYSQCASTGSAR